MQKMKPISVIIGSLLLSVCLLGCGHQMASNSERANDPCRNIPLINAAYNHRGYSQAQALLAHGANVNAVNRCGQTALTVAAELNNVDIADLLIKHGAKVDARTSSSATPLVLAASGGNIESAKLLLAHGADIEAKQSDWSPLIATVDNNIINVGIQPLEDRPEELFDMAKLLIDHGANVNAKRGGKSALIVAERRHFVRTVALLKQAGAK